MNKLFSYKNCYCFLLFFSFSSSFSQNQYVTKDSISILINKVSDKALPLLDRLDYNNQIYALSQQDSLIDFTLNKYVYLYYKLNDSSNFQKYSNKCLKHSQKTKNNKAIAKTLEYKAAFYKRYNTIDSTFYYNHKSFKIYENIKDSLGAGKILMNIAILQKNTHDYTGSKTTSLKSLIFLKTTKNKRRISSIYNNLGIIYTNLESYDKALEFHNKALVLRSEIADKSIYQIQSLNNIAKVYKDSGENDKAIEYLEKALLSDSLLYQNLETKAAIIDNLAHARFKKDSQQEVLAYLLDALAIRKKINDKNGIIISSLHLAEYYKSKNNTKLAILYAEQAEQTAIQTKKYRDYLSSLELIGDLYSGEEAKDKYKRYIVIRDSLDLVARKQKEQFAFIQLEVEEKDQLIKEHKQSNQKKYYLIIGLIIIVLIITIAYFFSRHKRQKQDIEFQKIIKKLDELQRKFFQTENKTLDENKKLAFKTMLKGKYNISDIIIEFWQYQIEGLSEAQIAKKLKTVTKEGVRKRRNKLYKKIREYYGHIDKIDKFLSVSIYSKNLLEFEESIKNDTN